MPRKSKIVLFLGAGASAPFGYPTTEQFLENIKKRLKGNEALLLADLMKVEGVSDIEHVLQMLDTLPLVDNNFLKFIKAFPHSINIAKASRKISDSINLGLSLREKIYDEIFNEYELNPKTRKDACGAYADFFAYLLQQFQEPNQGFIVFTTNYDRVIEDFCAQSDFRLIDGFMHEPRARVYRWEPKQFEEIGDLSTIKLFKLHGSLSWRRKHNGGIVEIQSEQKSSGRGVYKENILIYPASKEKPDIEPFITLYDYFEKHLKEADVLISIGFSFRDEYLNEILNRSLGSKKKVFFVTVGGTLTPIIKKSNIDRFYSFIKIPPDFPKAEAFATITRFLLTRRAPKRQRRKAKPK